MKVAVVPIRNTGNVVEMFRFQTRQGDAAFIAEVTHEGVVKQAQGSNDAQSIIGRRGMFADLARLAVTVAGGPDRPS
jgi:hypothetical protein